MAQHPTIVNLMGSILQGLGARSHHPALKALPPTEVKKAQNVVLFVFDGLGYDLLRKLPKNSFLRKHCVTKLHTVFPSTTTAAITTFMTGLTPREHGLTAWYMYLREFNDVIAILPFYTRTKKAIKLTKNISHIIRKLIFPPGVFAKVKAETHLILPRDYFKIPYNSFFCHTSTACWGYKSFAGLMGSIHGAIHSSERRKYIYAYWSGIDDLSHLYGKENHRVRKQLAAIDHVLMKGVKRLAGTNTLLLITADHGQVTTTKKRTVLINKHPRLQECLRLPLCGEHRAVFCYVHPEKRQQFEQYVKQKLGKYCTLHRAEEVLEYFGVGGRSGGRAGREHPEFRNRIGDYILLMKENYILRQRLPTDKKKRFQPGHHGGLSREEMEVPLVRVKV